MEMDVRTSESFDNTSKRMLKDKDYTPKDYTEFYGKDLIYDDEMYEDLTEDKKTNYPYKIKIKFQSGEMFIMDEDELKSSVIF